MGGCLRLWRRRSASDSGACPAERCGIIPIMQLQLTKPEFAKFIDEQVKAGRFRSPEEVLEEALSRMMCEEDLELDEETIAAIEEGEAQLDRGEGRPWEEVRAELRAKYLQK